MERRGRDQHLYISFDIENKRKSNICVRAATFCPFMLTDVHASAEREGGAVFNHSPTHNHSCSCYRCTTSGGRGSCFFVLFCLYKVSARWLSSVLLLADTTGVGRFLQQRHTQVRREGKAQNRLWRRSRMRSHSSHPAAHCVVCWSELKEQFTQTTEKPTLKETAAWEALNLISLSWKQC